MTDSTLKGAIIGFGFISSQGHLPAYQKRRSQEKDVEITAVADITEARRSLAHKALPEARIYENAESLLDAERALDFVDIATPPSDHAALSELALSKGLHVLCEKPLTTTLADAERILGLAAKHKRVLYPCHNYKYAPVVKAVREIIDSRQIGRVRSVTLSTFRNTHAKGVPEWNTHWRRQKIYSGGGIAMDHGSHSFYLMFDWLNAYPNTITAHMSTLDSRYDTEDNFSTVISFPSGHAVAHLTWTAGIRKVIYTIQGEKGAIRVEDDRLELAVQKVTQGSDVGKGAIDWDITNHTISSHWMDASHASWFNALFEQFKQAININEYVGKECLESHLCVNLITTAYRSAWDGCKELEIVRATASPRTHS